MYYHLSTQIEHRIETQLLSDFTRPYYKMTIATKTVLPYKLTMLHTVGLY